MLEKAILALAALLASGLGLPAWSATLLESSEVLAANAEAAAQLPPSYEFTLTTAGNYAVTLKDLGVVTGLRDLNDPAQLATLQSLHALVTRDLQIVAELEIEYSTDPSIAQLPETQTFAGTPGTYRVHVLGAAASDSGVGMFSVDVAPSGGGAAVFQVADKIAIASGPAPEQAVLQTSFTVTQAGTYRVRVLDRSFPAPLINRDVLVLQRSPAISVAVNSRGAFSTADAGTFTAPAGATYDLIVIATAGADVAGLYGVSVQGGPADAVIYRSENAVGRLPRARALSIANAGAHTLTLADLQF
ncbi:MAG TPA: hypothetical protein VNR40_18470, partial [Steroidobacter sp.]|nr:hypothetical protein [Steroidobacter sp.]